MKEEERPMSKKYHPAGTNMTPSRTRLGRFVRARRLELDLRQEAVAKLAGFSQNTTSAIEIGKCRHLNQKYLTALARALQCEEKELRQRIPVKRVAEPQTELGKLIRAHREELGLTPEDFAKEMGMSREWARCLEARGGPFCQHRTAKKLAEVLDRDVSVFAKFVRDDSKPTESELGQMVRTRKKELGMDGPQLAKELGVTAQFVSQIELGTCRLTNEKKNDRLVERLAQALNLESSELHAVRPRRRICQKRRNTSLGDFVTKLRFERGLTQAQVAKQAGVSDSSVWKIESMVFHPSRWMLEQIGKALECEIPVDLVPL